MSSGLVDLHCHYLPGIDDGVKTLEEGVALCRALRQIGYQRVIATPHIRTAMFPNTKAGLEQTYADFVKATAELEGMPELGLGAEHFFDDVCWELFKKGEAVPYPGGHAALIEFPPDAIPLRVQDRFFELKVKGVRPVLAHPERYYASFRKTKQLEPLLNMGTLLLLDVMSLIGRYGRQAKRAAERMLKEDVYYAACSDSHKPEHVPLVTAAIKRLEALVGSENAHRMLSTRPQSILDGNLER